MGDWKNWVCVFLLSAPIYPEISSFLHAFPVRKNEEKEGIREEKVWKIMKFVIFDQFLFVEKLCFLRNFELDPLELAEIYVLVKKKSKNSCKNCNFEMLENRDFFMHFSNKEHLLGLVLVHMSSSGIFVFWYVSSVQNCARVQSFSWRHPVRGCGKWENVVSFPTLSGLDGGSAGVLVIPGMARVARKFWTSCFSWKVAPSVVLT